jgi:hypothetical protein
MSSSVAIDTPELPMLAVDVRALVRILAVQGGRVEGGRQARALAAARHVMEAPVGALGRALAREHAGRVLVLAAIGVDAAGVGVATGQVLGHQEEQQVAPVAVLRHGDLGHPLVGQRLAVVAAAYRAAAHRVGVLLGRGSLRALRPGLEQRQALGTDGIQRGVVAAAQRQQARIGTLEVGLGIAIERSRQARVRQRRQRPEQPLGAAGRLRCGVGGLLHAPAVLGDLGQVAHPLARDHRLALRYANR